MPNCTFSRSENKPVRHFREKESEVAFPNPICTFERLKMRPDPKWNRRLLRLFVLFVWFIWLSWRAREFTALSLSQHKPCVA